MQNGTIDHSPHLAAKGGVDYRTRAKNEFLRAVLARQIASAPYLARQYELPFRRYALYKLAAGDGIGSSDANWESACTPGVFAAQSRMRPSPSRARELSLPKRIDLHMVERQPLTYRNLCAHLERELPRLHYLKTHRAEDKWAWYPPGAFQQRGNGDQFFGYPSMLATQNGDSAKLDFSQYAAGDWLFIYQDSSRYADWSYNYESILTAVTQRAVVQVVQTVGGADSRVMTKVKHYSRLAEDLAKLHYGNDLVLLLVGRGIAQWAYLVTTPRWWSTAIIDDASRSFGEHGIALRAFSYLQHGRDYETHKNDLIRAAKEPSAMETERHSA